MSSRSLRESAQEHDERGPEQHGDDRHGSTSREPPSTRQLAPRDSQIHGGCGGTQGKSERAEGQNEAERHERGGIVEPPERSRHWPTFAPKNSSTAFQAAFFAISSIPFCAFSRFLSSHTYASMLPGFARRHAFEMAVSSPHAMPPITL